MPNSLFRLMSLDINNLYSYGENVHCTFSYEGDSLKTLITGINHDEAGMDSNGSGKSSIFNIIFYVILGTLFQEENTDDILRTNTTQGSGVLKLTDGNNLLSIERGRGKKKFLNVELNGTSKIGATDTQTQIELLKILQLDIAAKPKELVMDLLNSVYLSTATVKGFMDKDTTSKDRFDLVSRFIGLKKYDIASDMAKKKKEVIVKEIEVKLDELNTKEVFIKDKDIKTYEDAIKTYQLDITQQQTLESTTQELLTIENNRAEVVAKVPALETQIEKKKTDTNTQLQILTQTITSNNTALAALAVAETNYVSSEKVLASTKIDMEKARQELDDTVAEKATLLTRQLNVNTESGSISSQRRAIQGQISEHLVCPSCTAHLMVRQNVLETIDTAALTNTLVELDTKAEAIRLDLVKISTRLAEIDAIQGVLNIAQTEFEKAKAIFLKEKHPDVIAKEQAAIKATITEVEAQGIALQTTVQEELTTLRNELKVAQDNLVKAGTVANNPLKLKETLLACTVAITQSNQAIGQNIKTIEDIKAAKAEYLVLKSNLDVKKKEAERYSFWELGFKNIKIQLITEFLPALEGRVNDYLTKLGVGMRVEFSTFKKKATSTKKDRELGLNIKQEFNIEAFDNKGTRPFNLFSQGERGRISTCMGLALNSLTKEKGSMSLDFFMIDEIADSLDETGLRELILLLEDIPGQKLIISHNDALKDYFDTTITAELRNGVSNIMES